MGGTGRKSVEKERGRLRPRALGFGQDVVVRKRVKSCEHQKRPHGEARLKQRMIITDDQVGKKEEVKKRRDFRKLKQCNQGGNSQGHAVEGGDPKEKATATNHFPFFEKRSISSPDRESEDRLEEVCLRSMEKKIAVEEKKRKEIYRNRDFF